MEEGNGMLLNCHMCELSIAINLKFLKYPNLNKGVYFIQGRNKINNRTIKILKI